MMLRRQFVSMAGALAGAEGKQWRGVFPIALTPFSERNELDLAALVAQYRLMHREGVPGFVWPQLASEWETLTTAERLAGAEALGKEAKRSKLTLVIGVQAASASAAVDLAKQAERQGADGIISLMPPGEKAGSPSLVRYFREVGAATPLPLFLQAVGDFSTDDVLALHRAVPTLRYVKDEAGQPLARFGALARGSKGQLQVFTGGHGKTMLEEIRRGFAGTMPAASFADLYARSWAAWERGDRSRAIETFGRATILINEIIPYGDAMKFVLHWRGVFPNFRLREKSPGDNAKRLLLDETAKKVISEILEQIRLSKLS